MTYIRWATDELSNAEGDSHDGCASLEIRITRLGAIWVVFFYKRELLVLQCTM